MQIHLGPFLGANLAVSPKLLAAGLSTVSTNHKPDRGDLRPWKVPLATGSTAASGTKTIAMLSRDAVDESIHWLAWPAIVHAVRSFIADDTTKRTYYTGSGAPKVTDNIIGLASSPYPASYRDLGIPKPLTVPILTETTAGTGADEERFYAYTYLSDWDEEGEPQVSAVITCKPGAIIAISNLAAPPSGTGETRGINRIRVYRTVTGTTGSAFYFLRDISLATSTTDDARVTGTDTLPSTYYGKPPSDLKNLVGMWNGMMAGISGNSVRYCEPFKAHAWPAANETLCLDTPVALAVFQKNLLILTTGRPRLVYGSSPEAMDDTPVEFLAACVSPQSVVSFGHGACWATSNGLAYVGASGVPRLLTKDAMLLEDWQTLNPATIIGTQYNGRYFGFYSSGGVMKGFMVDPLNPEMGIFFLSTGYAAAHFDPLSEKMYVLDGTGIKQWDAGASNMTVTSRSKVFHMPHPLNLGVFELVADYYPVSLTVLADSRAPWSTSVASSDTRYLPSGYLASDYQFEISSTGSVEGLAVAETVEEMKAA